MTIGPARRVTLVAVPTVRVLVPPQPLHPRHDAGALRGDGLGLDGGDVRASVTGDDLGITGRVRERIQQPLPSFSHGITSTRRTPRDSGARAAKASSDRS